MGEDWLFLDREVKEQRQQLERVSKEIDHYVEVALTRQETADELANFEVTQNESEARLNEIAAIRDDATLSIDQARAALESLQSLGDKDSTIEESLSRVKARTDKVAIRFIAFMLLSLAAISLFSDAPWVPTEVIELEDATIVGYIMKAEGPQLAILTEPHRTFEWVDSDHLVERSLCEILTPRRATVAQRFGLDPNNPSYPDCPSL